MTGKKATFYKSLFRPEIAPKEHYKNDASNQSPFGKYKDYPDTWPLYEKLSQHLNVYSNNILLTKGAEEGLKFVFDTFVEPGSVVIRPEPTFGLIGFFEELYSAKSVRLQYNHNLHIPISDWLNAIDKNKLKTSLIYLALPDNPTGSMMSYNDLDILIDKAMEYDIPVVLDLVYYSHYAFENDGYNDLFKRKNVIMVNSMSKSHGLAGLRVGWIIAPRQIIDVLKKHRSIQEVSSVAVKQGIKALKSNIEKKNIKQVIKWKKKFKKYFPSEYKHTWTNFVLLKLDNHLYYESLLKDKNFISKVFDYSCMKNMLRIGVSNNRNMRRIFEILYANRKNKD